MIDLTIEGVAVMLIGGLVEEAVESVQEEVHLDQDSVAHTNNTFIKNNIILNNKKALYFNTA